MNTFKMNAAVYAKVNEGQGASGKGETGAQRDKRWNESVAGAIKADHESDNMIRIGAAAALFCFVVTGEMHLINLLHNKLTPKTAYSFRSLFIPKAHDIYGEAIGLTKDADGKWNERPEMIVKFSAKADADGNHFSSVPLNGDKVTLKGEALRRAKAIKEAMKNGGELALRFEWMTRDEANTKREPQDATKAASVMQRTLTNLADNSLTNGVSITSLVDTARIFNLGAAAEGKILEAYTNAWAEVNAKAIAKVNEANAKDDNDDETADMPIVPAGKPEIQPTV